VRKGFVEEQIPQFFRAQAFIDHLQEAIEPRRHRHHLGQSGRRIDPVEQCHRKLRILAGIGRDTVLAHPARFLTLDRCGHQLVSHNPPRDDQCGLPPQIEGIAPRLPPQRIAPAQRHAHAPRGIHHHTIVRQMRQKRRLPPRAPAIGAAFITQEGCGWQLCVGVIA
jgi:rRNA maturation protein Nop10